MATIFDADNEAQGRLERESREKLVQAALERLEPSRALARMEKEASELQRKANEEAREAGNARMAFANNVKMAADETAKLLRTMSDSSLTLGQMRRQVLEGLPVLGGFFRSARELGEALSGASEMIRRSKFELALKEAFIPQAGANLRQMDTAGIAAASAAASAGMLGGVQARGMLGSRLSWTGQRAFDEERMMGASRDEAALSGPRIDAAIMGLGAARKPLLDSEARIRELEARREKVSGARAINAMGEAEGGGGVLFGGAAGLGMGAAGRFRANEVKHTAEIAAIDKELDQERQRKLKALDEVKGKTLEVTQAEAQARKANIAVMHAELAVLEQRDRLLRGQLQAVGHMGRGDRNMMAHALERIDRVGWDAAGPMARQMAMQMNPDKANKLAEKAAEDSGVMDRLPGDWRQKGTREGLDKQIREKEKEGRDAALADVKESAAAYDKTMKAFTMQLADALAAQLAGFKQAFEEALRARKVLGG